MYDLKKKAMEIFCEMVEEYFFSLLPEKLKRILDERSAATMLFSLTYDGAKNIMVPRLKEIIETDDPEKLVRAFFNFFDLLGMKFEYEVKSKEPLTVEITKCPYEKYVQKEPLACASCLGMLGGALGGAYGSARIEGGKVLTFGPPNAPVKILREKVNGKCVIKIEVQRSK